MATQKEHYWNYVDVLAFALALAQVDKFKANPEDWHRAVDSLRSEFAEKWPDAFDPIYFERPPGLPPYSPQVEHFLHVVAQGGKLSAPNPAYVVLEMDERQRNSIIEQNEARLGDKVDTVHEIAVRLKEMLAI